MSPYNFFWGIQILIILIHTELYSQSFVFDCIDFYLIALHVIHPGLLRYYCLKYVNKPSVEFSKLEIEKLLKPYLN